MAAVLDFCTLYYFNIFNLDFFKLAIPKNLGVDIETNILGELFVMNIYRCFYLAWRPS